MLTIKNPFSTPEARKRAKRRLLKWDEQDVSVLSPNDPLLPTYTRKHPYASLPRMLTAPVRFLGAARGALKLISSLTNDTR